VFLIDNKCGRNSSKINVTADHSDWVYQLNEKVKFKVSVTQNGVLLNNVKISYEIGPGKMTPVIKQSIRHIFISCTLLLPKVKSEQKNKLNFIFNKLIYEEFNDINNTSFLLN
jgi:hypothetical protein